MYNVYSVPKKVPEYLYPLYRSMGTRFKQIILKDFLRLDLQPVQLISLAARAARAKKSTSPPRIFEYSEEGAAGAFFCITDRGKLLQHKLVRVQCTKESTRVPEYRYPLYRSTGTRFKKVILKGFLWLLHAVDLQPVQLIAYCWVERNLGRYEHARAASARPRARAIATQSSLLKRISPNMAL